jgi:hypothetical protein
MLRMITHKRAEERPKRKVRARAFTFLFPLL